MRFYAALIILAFALAAIIASEHAQANDGLPVVNADFQQCVVVDPGPLRPPRTDIFHPGVEVEQT